MLRSTKLAIEQKNLNSQMIVISGDWSSYHYEPSSFAI
jgi:hypothetical protein